jgi:hypothetical protein
MFPTRAPKGTVWSREPFGCELVDEGSGCRALLLEPSFIRGSLAYVDPWTKCRCCPVPLGLLAGLGWDWM